MVIFGDDIGWFTVSAYNMGMMGYRTPNIDRVAKEGMIFTDYYAEQSCTAGRSSFITGQCGLRTGNTKVGMPGAAQGLQARDVTIAQLLKGQGYACTPSESNCFMLDVKRPGKEVQAALAQKDMFVGRIWPAWPNSLRITVGTREEMNAFQKAFTEVMSGSTAGLVPPGLPRRLAERPFTHLS